MVPAAEPGRKERNRRDEEPERHFAHTFATLRSGCACTGADFLPLTIWADVAAKIEGRTNVHTDFWALYLVRRGRGVHQVEGRAFSVARGDVYVMRPGMAHGYEGGDDLLLDALHFQLSIFDEETRKTLGATPGFSALMTKDGPAGRWLRLTPGALVEVESIVEALRSEWKAGTPEAALLVRAHFLRLLVTLARRHAGLLSTEPAASPGHEHIVAEAVRRLDARFSEPLRIERIAAEVGLSPDRFTEVFSSVMGRTPSDYLRHVRIEHACQLLTTTDNTVASIAQSAGFADAAHLTRTLRQMRGLTPTTLRRRRHP
jgi:AraC-like DNA-binding protein/mannose-6-phosphate isomerase-like protein (cupin superfamily)